MPDNLPLDVDLRLTPKEQELASAIAYLIKKSERYGINDETRLSGTDDKALVSDSQNRYIIEFAKDIFKVWAALYPEELKLYKENQDTELSYEKTNKELLKVGGYSPVSYPPRLTNLFQTLMPNVKIHDRRFYRPLQKEVPGLQRSRNR